VYAFVNLDIHRGFEADVSLAKDDLVAAGTAIVFSDSAFCVHQ
jgi:hypothetical protein